MDTEKKKALVELFQEILDRDLHVAFHISAHIDKTNENPQLEADKLINKAANILESDYSLYLENEYVEMTYKVSSNYNLHTIVVTYGGW